jgi:hypothetical protein
LLIWRPCSSSARIGTQYSLGGAGTFDKEKAYEPINIENNIKIDSNEKS